MGLRTRTRVVALGIAGASLLLAGCEGARNALGLEKQPPDEFAVVTRAPLSMPPDYGLRPPAPGADRPQEQSPRARAREILLGNAAAEPGDAVAAAVEAGRFSRGEAAILSRAGALNADPMIRQTVNRESTALADTDKSMFNKLLFWQEPQPPGTVVDPVKESQRLREAAALGEPANNAPVPTIERRERGWLEGIF